MDRSKIRNFSIIAHIDHGKSTLADRLLLHTGAISKREFREQILDDMELERERGITIKARAVRIFYKDYVLNLIDTPGHIDFTFEVSKSLSAVEGVLLLVDAAQGVEAQTVTNLFMALEKDLVVIPIVTKIDLPNADRDRAAREIKKLLSIEENEIVYTSAKTGEGTEAVLDAIIKRIPPPAGSSENPLRALIFDSVFDVYKGVVTYLRVVDGQIELGDSVLMMQARRSYEVEEIGIFSPRPEKVDTLEAGCVGYITCNIKELANVRVGDTVTLEKKPAQEPLPGYREAKPMVFCGLYPSNTKDFTVLREALNKLKLNDASFYFEPESSASMGFGFRCGFLGLLHMDIIRERLEREYDLDLIITAPNVVYEVEKTDGTIMLLENPAKFPQPQEIREMREPFIAADLLIPSEFLGAVMQLCQDRRGIYKKTEYLDPTRVLLVYEVPFSEVVLDFYDKVKSITRGYGSLNYDFIEYRPAQLVRLDILLNGERVDPLSSIVIKERSRERGKFLVEKLKQVIPRQLFQVAIQAAVGNNIIARENIAALKKNVTGKCYGGDITRKRKLWEKQKAGKKRMKRVGKVNLPQEAFISILKVE